MNGELSYCEVQRITGARCDERQPDRRLQMSGIAEVEAWQERRAVECERGETEQERRQRRAAHRYARAISDRRVCER